MITNLPTTTTFRKNKSVLNKLALFFLIISGFSQSLNAQVAAYVVDQEVVVPATIPLITPRTLLTPASTTTNDAVYPLALPFDFTFNGVVYTTGTNVNVSTNGFMTFGATAPATNLYTPISSATAYTGAISLYGADLIIANTATVGVGYNVSGAVGSQILKIEWICRRNVGTETTPFIFQLWLYEGTNVIEMKYRTLLPATTITLQGEIGLRGATNADFNNFNYSAVADWPVLPAVMPSGTANNNTVITRGTNGRILATSNKLFRFTPVTCFSPTAITIPPASITSSTATINWTIPSTGTPVNYQWEIRTSGAAGSGATGLVQSGTTVDGTVNTLNLSSLSAGVTYTFYIRTDCGASDFSSWTAGNTFATLCNPTNVPYYQPFNNGVSTNTVAPYHGVLPTCTSQQNVGLGNNWVTTYSDTYYPDAAMDEYVLMYNGQNPGNANAANVWFYTEGINMVAGTTYRLSYFYGGTFLGTIENKMEVAYFSAPVNTSLVAQLDNHTSIKGSSFENIVNFTPTTSGVFYIGFRAYSNNSQGQLYVDDIQVVLSACKKPTAVSVSSVSSSTAVLSWTPPTPAPGSGYAYYYNTTGVPPTNSTIPNGFTATGINNVTLTGLTGSTTYYFWVRGNCGFGEFGEWVALDDAGNPYFTTLVAPPAYCIPSGATFAQDPNGITNVTMGSINNTTGIEVNNYGNYTNLITNVAQAAVVPVNITYATSFTYDTMIWVDWNNDGDFIDVGEDVYTGVSTNAVPTTLNATFTVPALQPLGAYRLRIGGIDGPGFAGGALTPCRNGAYQAFEDYTINVIVAPPALTINQTTSTQCAGVATSLITLTTPISNFDTYSWSPSTGVTGDATTGWTISSNTTLTYILTGTQSTSPFSTNTVSFSYVANQPPTPITLTTPSGSTVCASGGSAVPITASGGIVNGFALIDEGFNGATNSWTVAGSGTGSPVGNWTLRPDGYTIPLGAKHSNDNTQFYEADSDAPGLGTTLTTTLTSPAFSTVGYTSLSLSYYHSYNNFSGDTAKVQVSTNGTAWTDLITYTTDQGTTTIFAHEPGINLDAYIGQATVYIRFRYDATWDWYWAIDNVKVSGSASSATTWSPTTGLYTDAAATIPYTGTGVATIYAKPTVNTTYTASASTPSPVCTATATQVITVTNVTAGTASGDQTICNGSPSDLILSGNIGTITGWQSANNAAFTVGVTNILGSAGLTTLTSALMGTITSDKYYRAVVTNGGCTGYSNIIHITINSTTWNGSWDNGIPDSTKIAIFDDDYTSTGDVNACSVIVSSGDVVFSSNDNLIIQNTLSIIGGTLVFQNNASLVQVNDVANAPGNYNGGNVGGITFYRDTTPVRKKDYTYWSSPVSPQTLVRLSPFTPASLYFKFDPAITNNWVSVPSNNLMDVGKGYIIRTPGISPFSNSTFNVYHGYFDGSGLGDGVPNNGTITTPIAVGLGDANLIGNPYPSALSADDFLSYGPNASVVDGTILLWTHNTAITANQYTTDDYAMYNYSGGIGTGTAAVGLGVNNNIPNGFIASGQGFFIKGLANGVATFENNMRVVGNNDQFFRISNKASNASSIANLEKNRVWLELSNNQGAFKQTMVGYITNATNDLDRGFDGQILEAGNVISFYSLVSDNKLGIQGRALPFDNNDIVPLGYRSTVSGNFTVKLSNFDGFFDETNVYLEDLLLNVIHDLKQSDYNFVTEAGTFDGRFQLRYTNSTLSNTDFNFDENTVIVYKNNSDIIVNSSNTFMSNIKVFDIRGRQLFDSKQINNNEFTISNLNSAEQVLILTITSVEGKIVNKKIVF